MKRVYVVEKDIPVPALSPHELAPPPAPRPRASLERRPGGYLVRGSRLYAFEERLSDALDWVRALESRDRKS